MQGRQAKRAGPVYTLCWLANANNWRRNAVPVRRCYKMITEPRTTVLALSSAP